MVYFNYYTFQILTLTRLGCFYGTAILSWGYGWGLIEVDIEAEVEMRLSRSLVGVEISLHWIKEEIGRS